VQVKRSARFVAALSLVVLAGCAQHQAVRPAADAPPISADKPLEYKGLYNVVSYAPGFMSGSAPEGDDGFEVLREMGVRTIVSVDGAEPDVEKAKACGLRYVHLPIGYNGMDHQRTLEIAKAVKMAQADGPVYIHCHHGKHRSAGAAGAAAVTLGWLTNDQARAKLEVSGTSPSYTGLFHCVSAAYPVHGAEWDTVPNSFPEITRPSGYVESMVEIDEVFDHLKAIEKAGWKTPADSPDLVPVAEAGRLADLFRTLANNKEAAAKAAPVPGLLRSDSTKATEIEDGLAATPKMTASDLSQKLRSLAASCTDCHARYRD
jgi:protein tyrosine phosphatase (PTP) superfamily phosphohydrolase (DUF442 family)